MSKIAGFWKSLKIQIAGFWKSFQISLERNSKNIIWKTSNFCVNSPEDNKMHIIRKNSIKNSIEWTKGYVVSIQIRE